MLTRLPLAVRATLYAAFTLSLLTILQLGVLHPDTPRATAVVLAPLVVCTLCTYVVTRAIVETRARALTDVFERFERGDVAAVPLSEDPEFRSASELFARLARELRYAEAQLRQRDAERRRLFADVVHELGTPVSSLLGLAEALERPDLSASEEARARIGKAIGTESDRLARFVEDLRDVAQLDDPALTLTDEHLDVAEIARDVIARFETLPGAPRVDTALAPTPILGDARRVEQVITNLLENARRHAPGAVVRVETRRVEGGAARLTVEDSGDGVPEEALALLGQRLRRLDASRTRRTGGSGLGLSIVRAIAARHDGRVTFRRSSLGGLAADVDLVGRPAGDAPPVQG